MERQIRKASGRGGFTLIELIVAATLTAILVAVVYGMLISYQEAVVTQESSVEIQQGARFAVGKLKRDLELIGAKAKDGNGQKSMIYAGSWELLFNGDLGQVVTTADGGTQEVGELDGGETEEYGTGRTYSGGKSDGAGGYELFDSDAETVRYRIETPDLRKGRDYSNHANDRELRRRINGMEEMSTVVGFGIRSGYDIDDSRLMPYEDGTHVQPLFKYWGDWDFDPRTPDTLWGDGNNDGELSSSEIAGLLNGTYQYTFEGPTGASVPAGSIVGGGISLTGGGNTYSNDEDFGNPNGALDASEDFNKNGRLDANLLDTQLHRVEIDLGVMAMTPARRTEEVFAHGSKYREARVTSNVFLRNVGKLPDLSGGQPPPPPTNCYANCQECGESMLVEFTASEDDGMEEQDVVWYEVFRMVTVDDSDDDTADDDADDDAGTPGFNFYTIIPAEGTNPDGTLRNYELFDYDIEAGYCYTYRIIAVDASDQRSVPCTTIEACCEGPNEPVPGIEDLTLWDSPCHVSDNEFGSITLMWSQAMKNGTIDPDIDEYWIYRTNPNEPEQVFMEGLTAPIARVPINEVDDTCFGAGTHTECFNFSDLTHAECKCRDEDFYPYGSNLLVWRDQEGSPGHQGFPPLNGASFGITTSSPYDESSFNKYGYAIRAHRATDDCKSAFTYYESLCNPPYNEAQSFNSNKSSTAHSRYSPPWQVEVNDVSEYMIGGSFVNTAKFNVSWTASPSEFCEINSSFSDPDIPDLTRYYIYRSSYPHQDMSGHLAPVMLMEDNSSPPSITPQINGSAPARILVHQGRVRGGWVDTPGVWHGYQGYDEPFSGGTGNPYYYDWEDSDQRIIDNEVWHIVTGGTFDLRPNVFGNPVQLFNSGFIMPGGGTMLDPVYDYMVAAVSANDTLRYISGFPIEDPTPLAGDDWSFGAACVNYASFDCPCYFSTQNEAISYNSLVTSSNTDLVDAIVVNWRWAGNQQPTYIDDQGNVTPLSGGLDLVYNIQAPSVYADSQWQFADSLSLDCGWGSYGDCVGYHDYENFLDADGNLGYGLTFQYGAKMKCFSGADVCTRILPLGVSEQAGFPDESHICYVAQHPAGSPDCQDTLDFPIEYITAGGSPTGANCQTGEVRIEMREMLETCNGPVLTEDDWVWWRVVRFSAIEGQSFPIEPENGDYECVKSDVNCNPAWPCVTAVYSDPSEYAARHECFGTYHYTGYWMNVGAANFQNPGDTHAYTAYPNAPRLEYISNSAGLRRYMFVETLNPNFNYKYVFTIGIKHPPTNPGAKAACYNQPLQIGVDQCNGGFDGQQYSDAPYKYTVNVDFANKYPCYPPTPYGSYGGRRAGDAGPPYPAAAGARDTLSWSGGAIESNTKPWKNWEWSWTIFHWTIPNPFGDDWVIDWTIGDHAFDYSGSYLRSDIDGMFGQLLNWTFQWVYDLGFQLCDWCVEWWGAPVFCVSWFWGTCHQDLTNLRNHNYLWSNFYPPICYSNTVGDYHSIIYDYMAQMHVQVNQEGRSINMALHGSYTPWDISHQLLNLEMSFQGSATKGTRLTHVAADLYQTVGQATENIGSNAYDDDWYSLFYLVCMNRVNPGLYGETFLYVWSRRDSGKSHDWKTSTTYNFYNTAPSLTWSSDGRTNQLHMKRVPLPENEARAGCSCSSSGSSWRCPTGQPLRCVLPPKGAFGFWAEPFVDLDVTEYRYDNLRIDPYCGKCPPDHLWAVTQAALSAPIETYETGNFAEDY